MLVIITEDLMVIIVSEIVQSQSKKIAHAHIEAKAGPLLLSIFNC